MFYVFREVWWFNYGKQNLVFPSCHSSAFKNQISLYFHCGVLGSWILKSCSLTCGLSLKKSWHKLWPRVRTEFPTTSEIALSVFLHFVLCIYYAKQHYQYLQLWNQNTNQLWKMLMMRYVLQYQIFRQDLILSVKISIFISLVCKFAFVFNKW